MGGIISTRLEGAEVARWMGGNDALTELPKVGIEGEKGTFL